MWNLIVGFISATFVLPVIQQPQWTPKRRALVTFAWCVVSGLVVAYLSNAFAGVHDVRAAVSSVLLTLVSAVASYKGFAKPTNIAPAIEGATSPPPTT